MVVSENGNTSLNPNTGELEMENVEINKDFPKVFIGKEGK